MCYENLFVAPPAPSSSLALDRLNPEQLAAVTHEGGPLLALAGAGTARCLGQEVPGSTRVATRLARELGHVGLAIP